MDPPADKLTTYTQLLKRTAPTARSERFQALLTSLGAELRTASAIKHLTASADDLNLSAAATADLRGSRQAADAVLFGLLVVHFPEVAAHPHFEFRGGSFADELVNVARFVRAHVDEWDPGPDSLRGDLGQQHGASDDDDSHTSPASTPTTATWNTTAAGLLLPQSQHPAAPRKRPSLQITTDGLPSPTPQALSSHSSAGPSAGGGSTSATTTDIPSRLSSRFGWQQQRSRSAVDIPASAPMERSRSTGAVDIGVGGATGTPDHAHSRSPPKWPTSLDGLGRDILGNLEQHARSAWNAPWASVTQQLQLAPRRVPGTPTTLSSPPPAPASAAAPSLTLSPREAGGPKQAPAILVTPADDTAPASASEEAQRQQQRERRLSISYDTAPAPYDKRKSLESPSRLLIA